MPTMPGAHQHFIKTPSPLSLETVRQQQFPFHTFVIADMQNFTIIRQHTLVINPEELAVREPVRATVVQTIGGAYVDDFGRGLPEVTISGTTGWRLKPVPDGSGLQDGWQAFKALRDDVFRFFTDAKDSVRTYLRNPNYQMRWYNWAQDEYYVIQPTDFQLQQSASRPLLYQYGFNFTCIQDIKQGLAQGWSFSIAQSGTSTSAIPPSSAKMAIDVTNLSAIASAMSH